MDSSQLTVTGAVVWVKLPLGPHSNQAALDSPPGRTTPLSVALVRLFAVAGRVKPLHRPIAIVTVAGDESVFVSFARKENVLYGLPPMSGLGEKTTRPPGSVREVAEFVMTGPRPP